MNRGGVKRLEAGARSSAEVRQAIECESDLEARAPEVEQPEVSHELLRQVLFTGQLEKGANRVETRYDRASADRRAIYQSDPNRATL